VKHSLAVSAIQRRILVYKSRPAAATIGRKKPASDDLDNPITEEISELSNEERDSEAEMKEVAGGKGGDGEGDEESPLESKKVGERLTR
jgi:hypothetical protein